MDWLKSKYCYHPPSTVVAMLVKHGYRQISRRDRTIARIDKTPFEISEFFESKYPLVLGSVERKMELYRREHSQDKITLIPEPIMMLLRRSEKQCVS